ncbi:hypothetical protein JI435_417790, partial [Parastagonospora nodorum SN15]
HHHHHQSKLRRLQMSCRSSLLFHLPHRGLYNTCRNRSDAAFLLSILCAFSRAAGSKRGQITGFHGVNCLISSLLFYPTTNSRGGKEEVDG